MNPQNDTFENKLHRLEQIVRTMEKGDVPLDESLKLFREGTELVRSCSKLLDEAELQVKMVLSDESGNPVEEDFLDGNDG
jgi:exodeoxyribonuclease VII small subunit